MTRGLGSLESTVMDRLWSADHPMSVREVHGQLGTDTLAYTTVMTVLTHLYDKGLVTREADGRAYRYRPVRSREAHSAELMSEVLSASDDPHATLLQLVRRLTPDQARALQDILRVGPTDE